MNETAAFNPSGSPLCRSDTATTHLARIDVEAAGVVLHPALPRAGAKGLGFG